MSLQASHQSHHCSLAPASCSTPSKLKDDASFDSYCSQVFGDIKGQSQNCPAKHTCSPGLRGPDITSKAGSYAAARGGHYQQNFEVASDHSQMQPAQKLPSSCLPAVMSAAAPSQRGTAHAELPRPSLRRSDMAADASFTPAQGAQRGTLPPPSPRQAVQGHDPRSLSAYSQAY